MKIYTNEPLIRKYQQRGLRFSMAGLAVMALSFFVLWRPEYALYAYPVLLVGLGVAMVGSYYANRWVRPPLPQDVMKKAFEPFGTRFALFHHTGPIPHLLVTPKALVALRVKRYEGPVRYDAATSKWQGRFSLRRFYGQGLTAETLGDPTAEVQAEMEAVRGWLRETLGEEDAARVPVAGVALFTAPKSTLEVTEPPVPLATADTLRETVQGLYGSLRPLPRPLMEKLLNALEAEMPDGVAETTQ